ncbi:putative uncharacterized protein C8orf89 homolog isoform X3 [Aquarana catesbeiana]|uniref:putative uncharacterized protein C8orf89 homolog isoform X3 n=1 Tax=Aquarana catesbeiana TaxID=8400 RepID=UPI003CC94FA1
MPKTRRGGAGRSFLHTDRQRIVHRTAHHRIHLYCILWIGWCTDAPKHYLHVRGSGYLDSSVLNNRFILSGHPLNCGHDIAGVLPRLQCQLMTISPHCANSCVHKLSWSSTLSAIQSNEHKCPVVPPSHGLFSGSRQAVLDIQTLSAGLPYNTCRDFQKWPAWKRIQYVTKTPKNKLIKFNGNDTRNSCIISN